MQPVELFFLFFFYKLKKTGSELCHKNASSFFESTYTHSVYVLHNKALHVAIHPLQCVDQNLPNSKTQTVL